MARMSEFVLTQPGPVRLYSMSELLCLPPPEWLVDRLMPEGGLVALYGEPGASKSFVAIDLALHVATGKSWQGRATKQGLVVYISAEGGTGMGKRGLAWLAHHHVDPSTVSIAWLVEPIPIHADSEQIATLITRIIEEIEQCPVLVIIDTLARCFDGDENQQEDMGRFIMGVDTIRHGLHTTVLVVHHTRLGGDRERGNTAFRGAADTMMSLVGDKEGQLTLSCTKQKDAEEFEDISLERVVVPGTDSCTIQTPQADVETAQKTLKTLDLLRQLGPLTWEVWLRSSELPKTTFHRIFTELKKSGQILKENHEWRVVRENEFHDKNWHK